MNLKELFEAYLNKEELQINTSLYKKNPEWKPFNPEGYHIDDLEELALQGDLRVKPGPVFKEMKIWGHDLKKADHELVSLLEDGKYYQVIIKEVL